MIRKVLKSVAKKLQLLKAVIDEQDQIRTQLANHEPRFFRQNFYTALNRDKLDIIDFVFNRMAPNSFADLGGIWGVDGGYTFYTLDIYRPTRALLVDTNPTEAFLKKKEVYPQLKFIKGNFGDNKIAEAIGQVDVIFLFDVLLHQVNPNWNEILKMYAKQTRCLAIYNQQWIGGATSVRLLELGEDEYFLNIPHGKDFHPYDNLFRKLDDNHPHHGRAWRDVFNIWQWGITDIELQRQLAELGFHMQYFKSFGRVCNLERFENHAFVFTN